MDLVDRRMIDELAADTGPGPRVSIYLPTHRTGREIRQDPIRLKNLLAEAQERLLARDHADRDITALLAPATDLLGRTGYWEQQLDGLALLLDGERIRAFRCPRQFDEICYVNDHFHVKPLLPLQSVGETFRLLSLSQNRVRLHEGTFDGLAEMDLGDIPASLADALGHDVEQTSLQQRTFSAGASGETIFHGHGAGSDDHEAELTRFIQLVDDGLRHRFGGERPPIVLAGVEEIVHKFRHVAKYDAIVPGAVLGNPDALGPQRLHAEAWQLARPVLEADAEQAAARFRELKGTELASDDLLVIGPAVAAGRVETLFVAADHCVWGRLAADGAVEVHDERQDDAVDLLDRIAVLALQRGARVHARRTERLPEGRPVAAVLRY
jgi:hypothetical protein